MASTKVANKLANWAIVSDLLDTYLDYNQKERQMYQNAAQTKYQMVKAADGYQYWATGPNAGKRVIGGITATEKKDTMPMAYQEYALTLEQGQEPTPSGFKAYKDRNVKAAKPQTFQGKDGFQYYMPENRGDPAQRVDPTITSPPEKAESKTVDMKNYLSTIPPGTETEEGFAQFLADKKTPTKRDKTMHKGVAYWTDTGEKVLDVPDPDYKAQTLEFLSQVQRQYDVSNIIKTVEKDTSVTKADLAQYKDQVEDTRKRTDKSNNLKMNRAKSQVNRYTSMKAGPGGTYEAYESAKGAFYSKGTVKDWEEGDIIPYMQNIVRYNSLSGDIAVAPEEFERLNEEWAQYKYKKTLLDNVKARVVEGPNKYHDKTGKEIKNMSIEEFWEWFEPLNIEDLQTVDGKGNKVPGPLLRIYLKAEAKAGETDWMEQQQVNKTRAGY